MYEFWITASYPNGSAGSSQGFTLTHLPSDAVTYVSSQGAKSDTHTPARSPALHSLATRPLCLQPKVTQCIWVTAPSQQDCIILSVLRIQQSADCTMYHGSGS